MTIISVVDELLFQFDLLLPFPHPFRQINLLLWVCFFLFMNDNDLWLKRVKKLCIGKSCGILCFDFITKYLSIKTRFSNPNSEKNEWNPTIALDSIRIDIKCYVYLTTELFWRCHQNAIIPEMNVYLLNIYRFISNENRIMICQLSKLISQFYFHLVWISMRLIFVGPFVDIWINNRWCLATKLNGAIHFNLLFNRFEWW